MQLTRHAFHAWQCFASSLLSVMWLADSNRFKTEVKSPKEHVACLHNDIMLVIFSDSKVQTEIARCKIVCLLWQVGSRTQTIHPVNPPWALPNFASPQISRWNKSLDWWAEDFTTGQCAVDSHRSWLGLFFRSRQKTLLRRTSRTKTKLEDAELTWG